MVATPALGAAYQLLKHLAADGLIEKICITLWFILTTFSRQTEKKRVKM